MVGTFFCLFFGGSSAASGFEAAGDSAVPTGTTGVTAVTFFGARRPAGLSEAARAASSNDTLRFLAEGPGVFAGVAEVWVAGATSGCALDSPDAAERSGFLEGVADEVVVGSFTDGCS